MRKRISSILLSLCLTLTLLPGAALASPNPTPTLYVGGVEVTSENAGGITCPDITGTVSYEEGTLTLNNASITGAHTADSNTYGIYADGMDLTIELAGSNTVIGAYSNGSRSCGVSCSGISGSGRRRGRQLAGHEPDARLHQRDSHCQR